MASWFDDDALWETMAPAMFSPKRMADAAHEVDQIAHLLELPPGAAVLDLCCGTGRHALELARRGHRVTAVDRTQAYLSRAEDTAKKENLAIEFVRSDMRAFHRPDAFDAVINLFTSFGYFEDPADDRRVLENVFISLRSGGRLLMELNGKEMLARNFRARDWHRLDDGSLFLEERTLHPGWDRIDTKWILINDQGRFERGIQLRLYSAAELVALARSVGFNDVDVFGSLGGVPYDAAAQRLIMRARGPRTVAP
jgi:SAM-dependent methyltransferase